MNERLLIIKALFGVLTWVFWLTPNPVCTRHLWSPLSRLVFSVTFLVQVHLYMHAFTGSYICVCAGVQWCFSAFAHGLNKSVCRWLCIMASHVPTQMPQTQKRPPMRSLHPETSSCSSPSHPWQPWHPVNLEKTILEFIARAESPWPRSTNAGLRNAFKWPIWASRVCAPSRRFNLTWVLDLVHGEQLCTPIA